MESKPSIDLHCLDSKICSLKRKRPPKIDIPNLLHEIKLDKLSYRDSTENNGVCFSGNSVGVFAVKGKKKFMEDTHKIDEFLQGNSKKAFFGVYDGHGGRKAAEFVAENLHTNIYQTMKHCNGNKEESARLAFLKTDQDFLDKGAVGGACCVTALIEEEEMVVSNLGDCRAVLCREGVAQPLTTDHNPDREDERKMIEHKGGYVEIHRGRWRVHGVLSVSRSIGDAHLKNWVVAEPDSILLHLTRDMEFLILASDGLWQEVENQEAIDIVSQSLGMRKVEISRSNSKVSDENFASPSAKARQIPFVRKRIGRHRSPNCKRTTHDECATKSLEKVLNKYESSDDFSCENVSPPLKLRRISSAKKSNAKIESLHEQENNGYENGSTCSGLTIACKELVNLALSRGSLDDITVMIIDLLHFTCNE